MRYDDQQRMCVPCGKNKFLQGGQDGVCTNCPAGIMSIDFSWTISNCMCEHGYGRTGSQQECSICELGKYADFHSQQCLLCPVGKYSSSRGMHVCNTCEAGTFIDVHGSAGPCQKCQIGKYRSDSGASTCISCLPGKILKRIWFKPRM